jgi:hypothetical protein
MGLFFLRPVTFYGLIVSTSLPMKHQKQTLCMLIVTLLFTCGLANAQTGRTTVQTATVQSVTASSAKLIDATQQYKASSRELLNIQEGEVNQATAELDQLRVLVADGLVAKAELETSEQTLARLRAQLEATKKQIADSDNMIAEIQAEQERAKTQAAAPVKLISKQYGTLSTTATILRYDGAAPWSLGGLSSIQSFFSATFGHVLPLSAVGQSATHDRLGYDHHNAVDVALHPDSSEGRALINYLQGQGIPFLAFHGAIPGVATGPHIHIGTPSHRLS